MASAERVARGRSGWATSTSQGSGIGSAWRPSSSERVLHPTGRDNGSMGHAACELLAPLPPAVSNCKAVWLFRRPSGCFGAAARCALVCARIGFQPPGGAKKAPRGR
jgi:hypothetical protein